MKTAFTLVTFLILSFYTTLSYAYYCPPMQIACKHNYDRSTIPKGFLFGSKPQRMCPAAGFACGICHRNPVELDVMCNKQFPECKNKCFAVPMR